MIRFGRSLGRREWAALTALGLGAGIVVMTALTSHGAEVLLPGMPPPLDPHDVYAGARPRDLSPSVRGFVSRAYVPNIPKASVDVIHAATYKLVEHVKV